LGRALILNATNQPLCVVSTRRAVVLVLNSKASLVETHDGVIRSQKLTLPVPSVVRLNYFVRVPYRARATLSKRAVFLRDDFQCQYCGAAAENVDHITPRSRGGSHTWDNVVASCRPCNSRKENRSVAEVGLKLRRAPIAPKESLFLLISVGKLHPTWEPYLQAAG